MRKKRFIQNMLGLSVSALLIRGVGMVWAVNAAQIMGAEMLGRYRLIVSVYAFFLLAAAAGVSVTVTRLAGEELARGNEGAVSFIRSRAVSAAFCIGAALGVCMFIASFFLPAGFFGSGAANALRVLSPALPLAGFSSAVRGYFTARRKNLRNAAEQLIEQLTELFVFIWSCRLLEGAGFSPIFCAALATTSAEAVSFIYSAALLCYDTRHTPPPEKISGLFPRARSVFVPCTASAGLRSALSLAESCLIPAGLMVSAGNGGAAMEDFGIITGMALPCVMFPSVFILPAAQLIVPELAAERALGHKKAVMHMSKKLLRWTAGYSLLAMLPFLLFPYGISGLLGYPERAGFFIRLLAPLIPLSFIDSIVDGMLKGLDCQKSYFRINMIESVLRIIMALTLVPAFGASGAAALIIAGELINAALSLRRLQKELRLNKAPPLSTQRTIKKINLSVTP